MVYCARLNAIKDAAAKALELDIARQRERAAKAEQDLLELQQRLAWRELTPEQVSKLTSLLVSMKGRALEINVLSSGFTEVERYADQLKQAFETAGVVVTLENAVLMGNAGSHREGLSATWGSNRERDLAIIDKALRGAGVLTETLPCIKFPEDDRYKDGLTLIVWPK